MPRGVGAVCAAGLVLLGLAGCVEPAFFVATEVAPRAVNGKGLAEDGADAVSGKDCRVIEGTVNKDRKVCETRGSPATHKDFKGLMGQAHAQPAGDPAKHLPVATP
jgi:hypothetical protein